VYNLWGPKPGVLLDDGTRLLALLGLGARLHLWQLQDAQEADTEVSEYIQRLDNLKARWDQRLDLDLLLWEWEFYNSEAEDWTDHLCRYITALYYDAQQQSDAEQDAEAEQETTEG